MRTRDPDTAEEHPHCPPLHSDMLCPPCGKGPGFKAIPALGQQLQSQAGQDSGNFSLPQSLSLVTQLPRHKNLGWCQYLYSLPEAASRVPFWAPGASFEHQGEPCTHSLSCPAARQGAGAGSQSSPQPGSQTGATFSETRGRNEVFVPQEGGTAARALLQSSPEQGQEAAANPSSLPFPGSRQEALSLPGSSERLTHALPTHPSPRHRAQL